ncbi:MAG: MFS transporter [Colwellia sp.]|nr:MFS transporter [Colwellia sp.]
MQSDVSFRRLKQFPQLMWILVFGAFITRGSYYMVWPFLAVILYEKFSLSATEVGLILSSAALVAVFVGFIGGALSDRFGRHQLMYASGILYVISFSLLAQVDTISGYIVVITLCSIATAIWQPPTSALIGDIIRDAKTRELAMQARYFAVNVGSAIGPMLGVRFGLTGQQSSFYITACAFAFLLVLLFWGFSQEKKKQQKLVSLAQEKANKNIGDQQLKEVLLQSEMTEKSPPAKLSQTVKILIQDKVLQCLIAANILCMFIYGQMDTSLIQYLNRAHVPNLLQLISSMIFTNACVIVTSQFVLLRLMAQLTLINRIQIGLVLLACSQLWLAFNPLTFFWGWIGAIIVMSLAEAILFPTMNVHIDRLAPDHLRGAYFGAASFYSLGFALAPLGGGIILDSLGGFWLFIISSALCAVVIYLYSIIESLPRPDFTKTKVPSLADG